MPLPFLPPPMPPQLPEDPAMMQGQMPMMPPDAGTDPAIAAPLGAGADVLPTENMDFPALPVPAPPGDAFGVGGDPEDATADLLARIIAKVGARYNQEQGGQLPQPPMPPEQDLGQ